MTWELALVGALLLAAWLWWDGSQKREIARAVARSACERAGVQFLDDSVVLVKLRLAKDDSQQTRLYRHYAFEFSNTGDNRLPGRVYLLGARILDVNLILPAAPETGLDVPPHDAEQTARVIRLPDRRE